MSVALADTSIFIGQEAGRAMKELTLTLIASVITLAELEIGVLRASDIAAAARRLDTLNRFRATVPLVAVTESIASQYASIASQMRHANVRAKTHDVWIAATALELGVPVYTQDADFAAIPRVEVIRV